jgi:diketogulonate reductase-like aldo/keto reductase
VRTTLHAFEKSVRKLGVERLDLLLLHQPLSSAFDRTIGAYRALEKLLADGSATQAWSPLGGITSYVPGRKSALEDPTLRKIAAQHGEIDRAGDASLALAGRTLGDPPGSIFRRHNEEAHSRS